MHFSFHLYIIHLMHFMIVHLCIYMSLHFHFLYILCIHVRYFYFSFHYCFIMCVLVVEDLGFDTNLDGSHPSVFTTKVLMLLEVGEGLKVLENQIC